MTKKNAGKAAKQVDLGPLPDLIGYALRRAQVAVFQDFFSSFARFNLRPAQFSVLTVIEHNPGFKQSQVCAALGIKRTNFVGLLDTLESRGLAERRPSTQDRRSYALYLTPAGMALMAKLRPVLKAHEQRFVARIGDDGREELLALLRRMTGDKPTPAKSSVPRRDRSRHSITRSKAARPRRAESAGT